MVIACAGNGRSGKNLFASLLKERMGENWTLDSIAFELKKEVNGFLYERFGLDSYSEITEEKNKFRDFLVWYANLKRSESHGRYWIDKIDKKVKQNELSGVNTIITDLRFCQYPGEDEVDWIKSLGGLIVYIKMYRTNFMELKREYQPPANIHEEINNKQIIEVADYIVDWEYCGKQVNRLAPHITKFCDWLENRKVTQMLEC